ncbi:MAG: aldehyde dehydrogenase family protein [Bdellovibrionales bacterium]|nr:aldehyde dehydrogenase family protein [Bdellovibrionales bacterium]
MWNPKNPYTGESLALLPGSSDNEIRSSISRATHCFSKWRHSTADRRAEVLLAIASSLETQRSEFTELLIREAGKPIRLAQIEVDRAVQVFRWAAGEAQRFAGELLRLDAFPGRPSGLGITQRFPRGVVLGITPFNFPLNLVAHKVAPALACGCSILIKPSPFTPQVALKLAQIVEAIEPGLMQVVLASDAQTEALTKSPEIATISFTGSAQVGWKIRRQAPEKPTTLELGGSAWVIVTGGEHSFSIPEMATRILRGAYGYAGQSCISVQNIAVHRDLAEALRAELQAQTESFAYGDPTHPETFCGPVIHAQSASRIRQALASAKILASAHGSSQRGTLTPETLIAPTLLRIENWAGPLVQQELFAPVVNLGIYEDVNQLVSQINSGPYGLQTGIFTTHWPTISTLYANLEVGGVIINDVPTTRYDHQPYGGVKQSGLGREGIRAAMDEMTEPKFLALSY